MTMRPSPRRLAVIAAAVLALATPLLARAQNASAAEALTVNLASVTGTATSVGEGFLYGLSQNAASPADNYLEPLNVEVPLENIIGQGITLASKHKDRRDPKQWKGFKFAIPFDYSMHNYLLRYYLAEHGIDPEADVQLRVVPPPEMVANLRADNIDGFLAPDSICQRAIYDGVGFLHILSKEIWDGHPCCSFTATWMGSYAE